MQGPSEGYAIKIAFVPLAAKKTVHVHTADQCESASPARLDARVCRFLRELSRPGAREPSCRHRQASDELMCIAGG
jgi:hypothetical protein